MADRKVPGFVSDYIAQNIFLQPEEKQLLLEERSPVRRLMMLCDMLHRELEIMDIQKEFTGINRYFREVLRHGR